MTIQLMDIIDYTTSDGPGFRTSVYCAGCNHKCKGCQNPHTWNFNGGKPTDIKEIYAHIIANDMSDVTFDMLNKMMNDDLELISIYYGDEVEVSDAEALRDRISEKYPQCDVELQTGGQPIYYYVISAE